MELAKSVVAEVQTASLHDVIMWKKPKASGAVVGSVVLMTLIFGVFEYTLLTFACRLAEALLVTVGGLTYFEYIKLDPVTVRSNIRTVISDLEPAIISAVEFAARILMWENRKLSGYIFGGSFVVAALGNVFSDLTMVLLATIGVFVVPPLYVQNRDFIDPNVKLVTDYVKGYVNSLKTTKAKTA